MAVALLVGYSLVNNESNQEVTAGGLLSAFRDTGSVDDGEIQLANKEILRILSNIQNIELEDDIFSNPVFRDLRDTRFTIPRPISIGRPNPFLPIGFDNNNGDEYLDIYNKGFSELEKNEFEQCEIIESFSGKTRREIISELENLPNFQTEEVVINQKKYKRDNKAIALIKILRKNECQICGEFIRKKDGTKYIEACHIKAKREKGNESLENIILLCPNHHKEFDLGELKITEHSNEIIKFTMNEKDYEIELKIDI